MGQKAIGKIMINILKNVNQKNNISISMQLLEVIKQNYGNVKSVLKKFLNIVSSIRQQQEHNSLLKIISILLKINPKYEQYNHVNTS